MVGWRVGEAEAARQSGTGQTPSWTFPERTCITGEELALSFQDSFRHYACISNSCFRLCRRKGNMLRFSFQSKSLIPFPKSTYLRPNARTFSVQPGLRRHPNPSLRSHQHSSGRLSTHALTLLFQTQPTSLTSGREGKRKQPLPFQISMHISKAVEFGQVHQDPCRTPPISLPAETAVANAPAWRAVPILQDGE